MYLVKQTLNIDLLDDIFIICELSYNNSEDYCWLVVGHDSGM